MLSLTLLAAFNVDTKIASAKTVNFASNTPTLSGTLPLVVAQDFGFFAAEGLDVRTVLITGGPTAMAALVGGGVDYTLVAGVAAVRAIGQGAPMVIISGMQPYMDYTLIGAKGFNSVNDLKGKVVGVTGPGGVAEFAAVEGLAKKGLVRDRDYKILYGVGNSPSRAQALETGKIQASPFSFLERLALEKKGFPTLFDIGSVIPGFPFVVIATGKQKLETDPEGIVATLRAINRGLDFLKKNPDKVAESVIKKNKFGDPTTVRQVINQFAGVYSTAISRDDIDALIAATKIEAEAKKVGGSDKFFALPIFPLRMQIHPYIFCSAASGIERPEDLKGKRIGMDEYRLTVGLWARGILQEYHGVRPEQCEWFTSDAERAGYQPPQNIKITVVNEPTEALLLREQIDALIPPNIVPSFRAKDPRIRRVFTDPRATVNEYFRKTRIFPITHTLVVRQSLFDENPWLVSSLLNAFTEAEERCRKSYDYAKRSAFPSAVLILEEEEELFGKNPWGHGLTPENQVVLEKFVQYANEQGYIPSRPALSDLFAPVGN